VPFLLPVEPIGIRPYCWKD